MRKFVFMTDRIPVRTGRTALSLPKEPKMHDAVMPRLGRFLAGLTLLAGLAAAGAAGAEVRIKDIVHFEGLRGNQLIGYGLVVGLDGTGDQLRNSTFTRRSIEGMLDRLGVGNLTDDNLRTENTAAVMVTATLPPFARRGNEIDIAVSSLGDATSLRGGTLLVTPLTGADGQIYAVGQGAIAVAGFSAAGMAASITEGVPTTGRIENGAIVEQEVGFEMAAMQSMRLALRVPDATTAQRIAGAINASGAGRAQVLDPGTVEVAPVGKHDMPAMMANIEQLAVAPDMLAKVVVDAKSGTIVIGENVRIGEVAISQGGLTISVRDTASVSQPAPISIGGTVVVPETDIEVVERDSGFAVIDGDVSLRELVDGLNAIGVTARQTTSILQAIKAAGALHADLEIL